MPLASVYAMFLCCLFGVALSDSAGCGHCMEQEEEMLMQLVNLQPNVESSQYHPGRARRFRHFRRFRRFGRYGGKTTSTEQETTTSTEGTTTTTTTTSTSTATTSTSTSTATTSTATTTAPLPPPPPPPPPPTSTTSTTSTTATTTTITTITTTTTRVVCTGGRNGRSDVFEQVGFSTPQNPFTFDIDVGSQCECVGSPFTLFGGSIPGYLGLSTRVEDANAVSFISITSPNGTEVKVAPVVGSVSGGSLRAATVAFNGFEANGNWTITLLNSSGGLSTQAGSFFQLEFGLIDCSQVLPTPDCAGNSNRGKEWSADNLALVGTTISPSPTLIQFDVEAATSCCVTPGTDSVILRLEFDRSGPSGGELTAAGLSPGAIAFNLSGSLLDLSSSRGGFTGATARLTQSFAGDRAAGLWNLSTSTDRTLVINNTRFRNPRLEVAVESCNQAR